MSLKLNQTLKIYHVIAVNNILPFEDEHSLINGMNEISKT